MWSWISVGNLSMNSCLAQHRCRNVWVCVHTGQYTHTSSCQLTGPGSDDTPVAKSTPSTQVLVSNTTPAEKEPELLG